MSATKDLMQKDDVVQAVLVADDFGDDFVPISNEIPLVLLPLVNRPLIDYSLEFLALGGIEETFLFCCSHADAIKKYIQSAIESKAVWSQTMEVSIIVSESCRSFGDCLRDLDAKGLIRGNFVLTEPGIVSNIKLLPIIKKHNDIAKKDKGAAMTIVYQESGLGQYGRCPREELLLATNANNRILFLKKMGVSEARKINFPLEIFLENSNVSIQHNLKDTHISICSPSVLPLFSDNFDYQTRDDFIKGLLMIDEVLDSTIYYHKIKGSQHGGAITNWRMYQMISRELVDKWVYPIMPVMKSKRSIGKGVVIGENCDISDSAKLYRTIVGDNVYIGNNVVLEDAYILSDIKIQDNCRISHSVISNTCRIKEGSTVTLGSILGAGVVLEKNSFVENSLVQRGKPEDGDINDKLGDHAYRLKLQDGDGDDDLLGKVLAKKFSRLHVKDEVEVTEDEDIDSSESDDDMSYTNSPIPDDTNMFYTEVTDSLARGFDDKLQCDNLVLEINSSRYAYNVTLKEVHYNVVKSILNLPFQQSTGQQYLQVLCRYLQYFSPILKNYIRNEEAMIDCLQAIEDVATSNNELDACITKILNWFYDKDFLSEESILRWFTKLEKNSRMQTRVAPFINWLQEAEEATSSEEESE